MFGLGGACLLVFIGRYTVANSTTGTGHITKVASNLSVLTHPSQPDL